VSSEQNRRSSPHDVQRPPIQSVEEEQRCSAAQRGSGDAQPMSSASMMTKFLGFSEGAMPPSAASSSPAAMMIGSPGSSRWSPR
jgi:hypothetical protein